MAQSAWKVAMHCLLRTIFFSLTKWRLTQWSSELSLFGFAKIGQPDLIYAKGDKENVGEFVRNVREMQWLVRFIMSSQ